MTSIGKYEGRPVVELLDDGRRVRLIEDFCFIADDSLRWPVPAGAIVDGASIPQILWSLMGGPFEGKYRNASIIHDWYCDVRSRDWRSVHKVFYQAMLASNVSAKQAKLMYAGVFWGGPRWSKTVVENTLRFVGEPSSSLLDSPGIGGDEIEVREPIFAEADNGVEFVFDVEEHVIEVAVPPYVYRLNRVELEIIQQKLHYFGLETLEEIDAFVDTNLAPATAEPWQAISQ